MVTYTGYMIPVFAMKRWLFWIYYLNPLSYGYEAIFANEFSRLQVRHLTKGLTHADPSSLATTRIPFLTTCPNTESLVIPTMSVPTSCVPSQVAVSARTRCLALPTLMPVMNSGSPTSGAT